jgi:hypothetical protein
LSTPLDEYCSWAGSLSLWWEMLALEMRNIIAFIDVEERRLKKGGTV